ncbi:NUDIX hydrolase [Kineosporia succinea]|uniref:8-oxo-dGTP diphosphatase n=1 Tax=Kineosporia succinea TaxID=84632 RepID=A0ABT9P3C7_9ACTN|nr:NUDIX domain-containing protein [Kineosporia succinea]MDP9826982.1 8-oxo-dGTP diphosphatase [Kineosporia succinea]
MSRRPTRSSGSRAAGKRQGKTQRKGRSVIPRPRSRRPPRPPAPASVVSAGALCWRPRTPDAAPGDIEVLLVRSARWNEWSWPKGKIKTGETLPECAVREVTEETGTRPALGRPLPSVGYVLPDGRDKTVHYWSAAVAATGERTAGADEIADVAWLPPEQARIRLTRPSDVPPLDALLEHARTGELHTRPLVVLRHAKARARANWPGTEGDRPLTSVGRSQANALPGLLAVWAPEHLLTSPWARCMLTLAPYLRARNDTDDPYAGVEVLPLLSEQGLRNAPERVPELLRSLLARDLTSGGSLVCTHRPVLETVMATLATACTPPALERLPAANPWLGTGEALVAHVAASGQIVAIERFRGAVRPS